MGMRIGVWVPTTDLSLCNISDTQENFQTNKQASTNRQDKTNSKMEGWAKDPKCFSPRDKTKNQQETRRFCNLGIRPQGARVIPPVLRDSRSSQSHRPGLG